MPKKKPEPELLSLKVKCSCGHVGLIKKEVVSFGGSEQECESCGHHGQVWVTYTRI